MRHILYAGVGLMALLAGQALAQSSTTSEQPQAAAAASQNDKDTTTIIVSGKAPTVVHKIDRTIYDLKDNPQATTGSVSDVLGTLPAVNVDSSGNVSVRGGSVQVVVDGKPSPALKGNNLAQALQSMPANTVARIEVITNPGPEFRTNAATVINIVTKKTGSQAPAGGIVINFGENSRVNTALSGSFGVGKWTFNGGLSLRADSRSNTAHVDRISRNSDGSTATHMVEDVTNQTHSQNSKFDLGASYAAGDNDTFNLAGNVSIRPRNQAKGDRIVFYDPTTNAVTSDTDTDSYSSGHYNSGSLTGNWKHKGKRDGETFTVQAMHEEDEFYQTVPYAVTYLVPESPDTAYWQVLTQRKLTDDLSGDYVLPLGTDTQFKTGFDIESTRTTTYSAAYDIDTETGAHTPRSTSNGYFLLDQTLSAAYIDYQHPLGKWIVEGGLRVENMLTRSRYDRGEPFTTTSDVQWSPSVYLSRDLTTKSKLKFSYSHRIDRPDDDQLFGLEQILDAQDIYTGNPYLKPAQTESFETGYTYTTRPVSFSGTFYLRQTRNSIVNYNYYRNPGDTVLITSVENAGRGNADGLDMSLDLHLWPKVDISLSSNIFHIDQTAPVDGVDVRQSLNTAQNKLTLGFNPTKADSLQIQYVDNGKELEANGWGEGQPFINLTYTRKLSPKLKLVVTDMDATNSMGWHQYIETSQYRDDTVFKQHGRIIYVGIDYKLGAGK
ncbi:MAG: TonB-dependent receptor [Asticcacaulis sp.]|uniref:TonB-dependent receptor n=1 Tax=Asticcacaulis sp. TaxID=1872648 RepID=UPI0039E5DDD0